MRFLLILIGCIAFIRGDEYHPINKQRNLDNEYNPINKERLLGGHETTIDKYPFLVNLQYSFTNLCVGTILDEITILTSAGCIYGLDLNRVTIFAGTTDQQSGGIRIYVGKTIIPKDYKPFTSYNDIAVLKLEWPLVFTDKISAATLPAEGQDVPEGINGTICGWGSNPLTRVRGEQFLHELVLETWRQNDCIVAWMGQLKVDEKMLCAGNKQGDACREDVGSPFLVDRVVMGVVAIDFGCNYDDRPCSIITRVSKYLPWIKENMG